MIKCILNKGTKEEKTYTIPFVSGRAMRMMEPAWDMYVKMVVINEKQQNGETVEDSTKMSEVMDTMCEWFCALFNDQFTMDELYDGYPSDKLLSDIFLTLNCVRKNLTDVLTEFPTTPVMPTETKKKTTTSRK